MKARFTSHIDQNEQFPLSISREEESTTITINFPADTGVRFQQQLQWVLQANGIAFTPCDEGLQAILPADAADIEITLNNTAWMQFHYNGTDVAAAEPHALRRLSAFEMRMLGSDAFPEVPYPREGMDADYVTPITDLHTHLSSQISATDLVEAAARVDTGDPEDRICYPIDLLELVGIDHHPYEKTTMLAYEFVPTKKDGLPCEQGGNAVPAIYISDLSDEDRATLASVMRFSTSETFTFSEMERSVYRFRNPLTKNPAMLEPIIQKVAEDYAAQGIAYAELAVTGALKPDWLAKAIPALEAAEASTGVSLRLLAAIPRELPPAVMLSKLQMVKYAAQSPYVVGVDFIGYESNKTKSFGWALNQISRWAERQKQGYGDRSLDWFFDDDFIIRVHAGENSKNVGNVREVLEVLAKYPSIRGRIGHGVYGDVAERLARELSEQGRLAIEFNPDSNIALNNLDNARQLPAKHWADMGVPVVLASDGSGAYQTDNRQLAMAGHAAGLTAEDTQRTHAWESQHVAHQAALFARKQQAFHDKFDSVDTFIEGMREHAQEPLGDLSTRTPILVAGASGDSWQKMTPLQQAQTHIAMEMLVQLLDPQKVYFAMGRVKDAGVGNALDTAVNDFNLDNLGERKFYVKGLLLQHGPTLKLASSLTHISSINGSLYTIPEQMIQHIYERDGHAFFIGGSEFTRGFIHNAQKLCLQQQQAGEDRPFSYALMHGANGASRDIGKLVKQAAQAAPEHVNVDDTVFESAVGMIRHLANRPDGAALFNGGHIPTPAEIQQAYNRAVTKLCENGTLDIAKEELATVCDEALA